MFTLHVACSGLETAVRPNRRLRNSTCYFPPYHSASRVRVSNKKQTVLPDGQSLAIAFTVLAYMYGTKAKEEKIGVTIFTKRL